MFFSIPQAWGQEAWINEARLFSPEINFPTQLKSRVAERQRIESIPARAVRLAEKAKYEKTLVAKRRFFSAKASLQAIGVLKTKFVADGADAKQAEELLKRVLKVLKEDAKQKNRSNELSVGFAFWLMSCERVLNGRQLDEKNYAALIAGLDEVFEGYAQLDKVPSQRKQTSFELMGVVGGVITGLDLESQKNKNSDSRAQAVKLAEESLVLFQLTPQNLGEAIGLLIWLGYQRT
ncbi:MAG: hypothetical protein FWG75_00620 [Cystobacterineae bacterium]|nr:hypothetical protein [Cystobacterineae bacterium]